MAKIGMMRIYKKQGPRTHLRNAGNASNCRRTWLPPGQTTARALTSLATLRNVESCTWLRWCTRPSRKVLTWKLSSIWGATSASSHGGGEAALRQTEDLQHPSEQPVHRL